MENNCVVIVYLSGHGYQTHDLNYDEADGLDEYIIGQNGEIILDDNIKSWLVDNLPTNVRFIGIADTCHSSSMFDLNGQKGCISIGACADNELENCDVGEKIGFGGALTIQLLESMIDNKCLLEYLIVNFNINIDKVQQILTEKLKPFGQHPLICHS